MNLILFDDQSWEDLLPLTFTKPISKLRVGILTIAEKWESFSGQPVSYLTRPFLQNKFPLVASDDNLLINATLLPEASLTEILFNTKKGQSYIKDGRLLAARLTGDQLENFNSDMWIEQGTGYAAPVRMIDYPWKIFGLNGDEIKSDIEIIAKDRQSEPLSKSINVIGSEKIFVEKGFKGEYFTLNASSGPIYLGPDSEIMEGSLIRGPFSLGENSTIKLAAKIYGPTSIGPHCKAGGEINNSVLQAYSNKGHDGFLGNSVIGEWCNLGADTNNSNLKNNYAEVKLWNYKKERFVKTGLTFCGLIMGDHSKCGINTMFNTGTVVGVSANIFGSGFPRNFIPSFSWGGAHGFDVYKLEKVIETANLVMERRDLHLDSNDREILEWVFEYSKKYRKLLQ